MKTKLLIFILLLGLGCSNVKEENSNQEIELAVKTDTLTIIKLPIIGEIIADSIKQTSNNRMQLINSSQFSPSTTVYCQGSLFNIAWDNNGKVNYMMTTDTNFVTDNNVKVNVTLKEVKRIQDVEIFSMPGWGYYIRLNSDWFAAFCIDSTCTGRDIEDNDKINWIYKW